MFRFFRLRSDVQQRRNMTPKRTQRTPLATHLVLKVSAAAPADPRTVRKLLRGALVSPMVRERIVRALHEMGLDHLVPQARARGAA